MDGMGRPATFVNGHRGQDGAIAAAPAPQPLGTPPPSLQVDHVGPVSDRPSPPHDDAGDPGRTEKWRRVLSGHRAWLAAVPIVLVNSVAFAGQLAFLRGHLPWPLGGQVLVAVTLESVAVYLAWQAHLALAADDSAMRLRLAAYGFAAVIGIMNYSHYMAPGWRPTFAAVTFGLMSVSSPWLWSVHSRRASRDALKARGLIESHAVRLGATRWMWHPWRSAKVMWHATWKGENDPVKAIALAADGGRDDGREAVTSPPAVTSPAPLQARHDAVNGTVTPTSRQPSKRPSGLDKAAAVIKKDGTLTNKEVAKRARVSESTARRARASTGGSR